jgi:hypothetical protein
VGRPRQGRERAVAEKVVDILVRTPNPAALDRQLPMCLAVVVQTGDVRAVGADQEDYLLHDGCYVVRCIGGDPGFVEFAMRNQGYAEVVRRLDEPL